MAAARMTFRRLTDDLRDVFTGFLMGAVVIAGAFLGGWM
jgi:hypothetical protein